MSDVERNKGKLIPSGIDTEFFTDEDWDNAYDNGMLLVDGELYIVEYEVEASITYDSFADIVVNDDGTIHFHTMHYNGAESLGEVIERALNEKRV